MEVLKTAKKFETQIINYTYLSMVSYIVPKLMSINKDQNKNINSKIIGKLGKNEKLFLYGQYVWFII